MQPQAIKEALVGLPLGPWRYFDQIGSTNAEAAQWAEAGAPDLALVVADEQTAGRGRMGRAWFTPPGAALAFSLVLRPAAGWPETALMRLTALGALAVSDALMELLPQQSVEIKWPNDVLIERRKVTGILVEAHWQQDRLAAAIIGIGVNVTPAAVPPPAELLFPATCVEEWAGRPVDRLALLRRSLERLLDWRSQIGSPACLQAWEQRLAYRGEWVELSLAPDGAAPELRKGQVIGLEEDGGLRLLGEDGAAFSLHTGEIRLRPVSF